MIEYTPAPRPPHPVAFDVAYPERLSRWRIFVKLILAIPHFIIVYLLYIPLFILTVMAWFAILFTGRYPKAFFDFNVGILRWGANVFAYVALLRDEYPPFSFDENDYPLRLVIERPERQSRIRLFVRAFTIIPNQIVFFFVQLGFFFTTFLSWWAILFTGRYPRGFFRFATGTMRWYQRQNAYSLLLRDEYPPYSVRAEARPGNEVVSGIIGAPIFAIYAGIQVLQFQSVITGDNTVDTSLDATVIARQRPEAEASGLRVRLVGYDEGFGSMSFDVEAEKDGWIPAFFTPWLFSLERCSDNRTYDVADVAGDEFDFYFLGGSSTATVWFDNVPSSANVCALTYFTGTSFIRFDFE